MGAVERTSAVADVLTAAAMLGAVLVAGVGLQAWNKGQKGRAEFHTARILAKDALASREAVSGYRSPLWSLTFALNFGPFNYRGSA